MPSTGLSTDALTFEATTREESSVHEAKLERDIRLYSASHHHITVLDLIAGDYFQLL